MHQGLGLRVKGLGVVDESTQCRVFGLGFRALGSQKHCCVNKCSGYTRSGRGWTNKAFQFHTQLGVGCRYIGVEDISWIWHNEGSRVRRNDSVGLKCGFDASFVSLRQSPESDRPVITRKKMICGCLPTVGVLLSEAEIFMEKNILPTGRLIVGCDAPAQGKLTGFVNFVVRNALVFDWSFFDLRGSRHVLSCENGRVGVSVKILRPTDRSQNLVGQSHFLTLRPVGRS